MAFFNAGMRDKYKKMVVSHYALIKNEILRRERLSPIWDRISALNPKKSVPACIVAALLLAAGLVWGGRAAVGYGLPAAGSHPESVAVSGDSPGGSGPVDGLIKNSQARENSAQVSRGEVSRGDLLLMARVIQGEAADEPLKGKVAVGAVIMNRTRSGLFPKEIRGVVYQDLAFEAVANGQYMRPLSKDSVYAAEIAVSGQDPTGGALYYWNPATATSGWVWQKPIITQIGRHVFAR